MWGNEQKIIVLMLPQSQSVKYFELLDRICGDTNAVTQKV